MEPFSVPTVSIHDELGWLAMPDKVLYTIPNGYVVERIKGCPDREPECLAHIELRLARGGVIGYKHVRAAKDVTFFQDWVDMITSNYEREVSEKNATLAAVRQLGL